MNRERAETHLRLLAEAELRAAVEAGPVTVDRGDASFARLVTVARALADVHALDYETADAIMSDHTIALGARQRTDQARRMMRFPSALGKRPALARPGGGSHIVADPPNPAGAERVPGSRPGRDARAHALVRARRPGRRDAPALVLAHRLRGAVRPGLADHLVRLGRREPAAVRLVRGHRRQGRPLHPGLLRLRRSRLGGRDHAVPRSAR